MDLKFTEHHELIRKTARDFALEKLAPGAAERDRNALFPEAQLRELAELGFCGIILPEEYGGAGLDTISYCIAVEELSRVDASIGVILSVTNSLVGYPILKFGTEEQKKKYLPSLASGGMLGAFCLTEPEAGSDAGAQVTTAVMEGEYYIVNGAKHFVTSAQHADLLIVTVVTDRSKGAKGTSSLILKKEIQGIKVQPPEHKLGIRGSETHAVVFEDCRVPVADRLGREGDGLKIALTALDTGRLGIAAQALGIAQASLDLALQYSHERRQFGKALKDFQATQFKLADMATRIQAGRLLMLQAAWKKDQGENFTKEAAMAKLFCSETAMWAANHCVQILGGYGFTVEYPAERYFRDAKITEIYEGTSEIQRIVIASKLLSEWARSHA